MPITPQDYNGDAILGEQLSKLMEKEIRDRLKGHVPETLAHALCVMAAEIDALKAARAASNLGDRTADSLDAQELKVGGVNALPIDGDSSDTTVAFSQASSRGTVAADFASGSMLSTLFGKIRKWFADLKALAFKDKASLASDVNGTLPVPNGGTGKASVTANNFLVGAGTNALIEKTPTEVRALIGAGTSSLEIGTSSTQAAAGNHDHASIIGNANGYNKATGSAVRGLLDLGKFSYSSNLELSATFRISYTDARQYAPVEILLRLQIKYLGNATDGIVSIDSAKFYAYKIRSGQNRNTTDYECYLRIIDGELHVLVGMTSTGTSQSNIVVRCLWNVQSFRSPFTMLNEEVTELPDYTSMIVVPKYHMAYADAAGANGAPVTVDKYGKLLPLDEIHATSVGYMRLDGTVSDFDTYSVMVMDADGVVYKDDSTYKKLSYRAQDNCLGSNIDGWATMLEPKALSSMPPGAPDILHVPLIDSSRYVRTDQSSTPTCMVYSRSTNTLSVNVNGKVNGKTFVFGEYGGAANTVYFC